MGSPILEVEDVTFGYTSDRPVLQDTSFRIDEPEFLCIVGPNGVGKSTLVRCVNGSIKPSSGTVRVHGRDVSEYPLKELALHVSYVPVATEDYSIMSVLDTVLVGRYTHQKCKITSEGVEKAYKALRAMQVQDLAMRKFNELSAGQHQKVALARGLVQEADFMILDEPTSNLDPRHQVYVSSFLRFLSKKMGVTVIMISHDLNVSAKYADRLLVMERPRRIHSIGAPREVINRDMIRRAYNIDCDIVDDHGKPHVMLQDFIFE